MLDMRNSSGRDASSPLAISHVSQRLVDCAHCMGPTEVVNAADQYECVQEICQARPFFDDSFITIPISNVHATEEQRELQRENASRAAHGVANLANLIGKMRIIEDLVILTFPLSLIVSSFSLPYRLF